MLTLDVPVRTTRPREVAGGVTTPFRPDLRMVLSMLMSPGWLMSMWKHGHPRFVNLRPYVGENAGINEVAAFARDEMGGAFTWEEVERYRERWKRPLVVKGILHPADAEKALSLGVDGIVVSNHGGRQVDALPAADRLSAGHCCGGRRARDRSDGQRHSQRLRRGPRPRARRQGGDGRQGFSMGAWRARIAGA